MLKIFFLPSFLLLIWNFLSSKIDHTEKKQTSLEKNFDRPSYSRGYKIINTYSINSGKGFHDYISVCHQNHNIYVSHESRVDIINEDNGDSVGIIPNTSGVHGITFIPELEKGFTSNAWEGTISIFNLYTNKVKKKIKTGGSPDVILYDPFFKKVLVTEARKGNLIIIDPVKEQVEKMIPLGGDPEAIVSGENGLVYVNLKDKNAVAVIDIKRKPMIHQWPLSAIAPTGLAIDAKNSRLFSACEGELVVLDAINGNIIDKQPIGIVNDGVVYDKINHNIIISCNGNGTTTYFPDPSIRVIHQFTNNKYGVTDTVPTLPGASTISIDQYTGELFLPAYRYEGNIAMNHPQLPGLQVLVLASK